MQAFLILFPLHHVHLNQSQLPMITEQVRLVLARGGYKTGGALTQINDRLSPPLLDPTHPPELVYEGLHGFWLPLAPASAFMVLRAERQQIYLERFAAAHPSGGWMLTTKAGYWGHDLGESLAQFLTKTHKITSTTEDSDFVLIRYDPR